MKSKYPEDTFYEIVKRNTRTDKDLTVLPKAVKGRRAAQAAVDRLQRALEISASNQKDDNVKWVFRVSRR